MQDSTAEILRKFSGGFDRSPFMWGIVGKMMFRALRSPRRELRNELNYVQSGVKMNEISCLKVRHVEHKIWETRTIPHRPKCEVGMDRKRTPNKPYTAAFAWSFQQYRRSETLVFSGDLSGKLSSPAVQQLWTLYPGKQTANLF
ncbi:hypothetical protein Tco_0185678 [Tanacetum coccineum]